MKLSVDEVRNVAGLARLNIAPDQIDKLADQLAAILAYMDKLNEVDTTGVTPTSHAVALTNAFREDVPSDHLPREQALANAPAQSNGSFQVPKVI